MKRALLLVNDTKYSYSQKSRFVEYIWHNRIFHSKGKIVILLHNDTQIALFLETGIAVLHN